MIDSSETTDLTLFIRKSGEEIAPGVTEICGYCGSADVEGIARLTKYYSKISGWNKGKMAELRSRKISGDF